MRGYWQFLSDTEVTIILIVKGNKNKNHGINF